MSETSFERLGRRLIELSPHQGNLGNNAYELVRRLQMEIDESKTKEEQPFPWNEIIDRCLLKAEAASWVIARQRLLINSVDFRAEVAPLDRELIQRGKAANCYLWMCNKQFRSPGVTEMEVLGGCFETLAFAVEIVRDFYPKVSGNQNYLKQLLTLLAEAQSALLAAVQTVWNGRDSDQLAVYDWLRDKAHRNEVYINRFMRSDDLADPSCWRSVDQQLRTFRQCVIEQMSKQAKQRQLISHLSKIASDLNKSGNARKVWEKIAKVADQLVNIGVPPSSCEFREILLPYKKTAPNLNIHGFSMVMRELDRFDRLREEREQLSRPPVSSGVMKVAKHLENRKVLLVGDKGSFHFKSALEEAFGISELIWVSTGGNASASTFEPLVSRNDVAMVLFAVRRSSKVVSDVRQQCIRHGKLFVRIPGGFDPAKVATQILAQCGNELKGCESP